MSQVTLPHDAKAGPTKPEVRAATLDKLSLRPTDHFVDVDSYTGSVTIEAARRAEHVTAVERKPDRLDVTRKNPVANDYDADVTLRGAEAPGGLPTDVDTMFVGGSRSFEAVLDHAVETSVDRIVINVSWVEPADDAIEAFRERDLLSVVVQLQVSHGHEFAGVTSSRSNNPVYVVVGRRDAEGL